MCYTYVKFYKFVVTNFFKGGTSMRSVFKKYLHITSLRRKMILSFSALLISALAILQAANTYQTIYPQSISRKSG